jgi:hypothetical protein
VFFSPANTGGVRHHYMRHIKFVVENIHREICRSRTTSIQAVLQQRGCVSHRSAVFKRVEAIRKKKPQND